MHALQILNQWVPVRRIRLHLVRAHAARGGEARLHLALLLPALGLLAALGTRSGLAEDLQPLAGQGGGKVAATRSEPPAQVERDLVAARAVERDLMALLARVDGSTATVLGCEGRRGVSASRITGAGSGVIVGYAGGTHLVTNAHVVDGCPRIEIVLPSGRHVEARVRATDKTMDLALLSFVNEPTDVSPFQLDGRGIDGLAEGTWVVAVGNPFLLAGDGRGMATLGVLSGCRAGGPAQSLAGCTLQHDAEINPGSSGGSLWSVDGRLLAINGAIVTRGTLPGTGPSHSGASFAIPVDRLEAFLRAVLAPATPPMTPDSSTTALPAAAAGASLAATRTTQWLRIVAVTTPSAEGVGATVLALENGSPMATGAGLRVGDRITSLLTGDRLYRIKRLEDLEWALREHEAGASASIGIVRAGREEQWTGILGS